MLKDELAKCIAKIPQEDYPVHSRVHPLKNLPHSYIKREDELGCILSGSKVRKYRTQVAAIKKKGYKKPFDNSESKKDLRGGRIR